MAPQKVRGGKAAIDRTYGHLEAIAHAAAEGHKLAIYNSQFARKQFELIQEILTALRDQLRAEIEPYLERQAPDYDRRLTRLEQQLSDLIERSSMPSLLPQENDGELR